MVTDEPGNQAVQKSRGLAFGAAILGVFSVVTALMIGWAGYAFSVRATEQRYQQFYLEQGRMLAAIARYQTGRSDEQLLQAIDAAWRTTSDRPEDEYICIVDSASRLVLHSAHPQTVGNDVGSNVLLGSADQATCSLRDLAEAKNSYLGYYISSAGQEQLAAFLPVRERDWVLGVHRSKASLRNEIRAGMLPFVVGYLLVCGFLLPVSLFLLYRSSQVLLQSAQRSQVELRASETRYRAVVDSQTDLVFRLAPDTTLTFANDAFCQFLGAPMDTLLGRSLLSWVPDSEQEEVRTAAEGLHLSGPVRSLEHRLAGADGAFRWYLLTYKAVLDDAQEMAEIQVTGRDITARKEAERQLKQQQYYLERAQELGRIGTWELDLREDRLYWTDENCRIFGMPEGSIVTYEVFLDRIHPDDRDYVNREWVKALEGLPYDIDHRLLIDGATRWVREKADVSFDDDGCPIKALGFTQDITDQKLAEAERERLMLAIEQSAESIVIADTQGVIQYVNPAFERITGYTRSEALGKALRFLEDPDAEDASYGEMWQAVSSGGAWRGHLANRRKDGTAFVEEATVSPVRDPLGMAMGYVAVKRDITDEMALQEQLQQAQRLQAVGQLAGGVAHDFNNLLQVISGYATLALENLNDRDLARTFIGEVSKAGDRAATLVSRLLAFSRQQVLDIQDIDLNHVVMDVTRMVRRVIGEHIVLVANANHQLGSVCADPGQIEQILLNLCVNSRDAMPAGGTITIRTESARFDEAFCEDHAWAKPGEYAVLDVTDTGCGMDEDTLSKAFEPFFSTKEVGAGTGLGLSMVYGLVEQHGGFLHAESEPGRGTTMRIHLPFSEGPVRQEVAAAEAPAQGGNEIILVAEDEAMVRDLSRAFLEGAGYRVLTAADGEEAVEVFQKNMTEIDMAVLDVVMPKLGGRAVLEAIRKLRPGIRVLFSSGYSMDAIHTDFVLDEGLELIAKPYGREAFLGRVREILDR